MYELIHGDCIEALRRMPDKSVDCIVTDPPYGVGIDFADYADTEHNLRLIVSQAVPEMRRVASRIVLTCGITNIHLYPQPTWTLAWVYPSPRRCSWGYNHWQPILVYGSDPFTRARMCRPDVIRGTIVDADDKHDHPTPKPLSFVRKLLNRVAPSPTDTILDPFMGSGTTGVAAIQLGHRFTGIEINGDYLAIAKRRIAAAKPDFPPLVKDALNGHRHF